MNAILVFSPSNDLLFAKSSTLFRQRVLKYSKLNHLIASAGSTATFNPQPIDESSSSSSTCSSPPHNDPTSSHAFLFRQSTDQILDPSSRQKPVRRSRRYNKESISPATSSRDLDRRGRSSSSALSDTSEKYLNILMLLLTPYVASLRLNNSANSPDSSELGLRHAECKKSPDRESTTRSASQDDYLAEDLLSKFMNSININHECKSDTIGENSESLANRVKKQQNLESEFVRFSDDKSNSEFTARKISTLPMPIECLKDCQIAYCELQQFIFIYMQELQQVSSFKMRLLQKRVDLFARISLALFGPSLNSLRRSEMSLMTKAPHFGHSSQQISQVDQSQVLRQVYDVWLTNQFEAQFLLEANERLIVSKSIQKLCHDTLQKVSVHMRKSLSSPGLNFKETHVHAFLYSETKLVSHFACRNSQSLNQDDLILLLLFLKTHLISEQEKNSTLSDDARKYPNCCYASNFKANKRTYEINTRSNSISDRVRPEHCKFPTELLIYLSTSGKLNTRVRVPHMLRFVTLTSGVTLVLISEISTSYLGLQMSRLLGLVQEFNKVNHVADIKLSQLTMVNDCVCAIKNYFYGQDFDQSMRRESHLGAPCNNQSSKTNPPTQTPPARWGNFLSRYFQKADIVRDANNNEIERTMSIYHKLTYPKQKMCRQLMCRLEELISNNVHTYMRRTFNRQVDERKREALLTSVNSVLRESLHFFVMEPQLDRLSQPQGDYAKNFADLMDECRLISRKDLSDYLEYLSVKSTCNVTLGAPLTHDMPAFRSFIYIDRNRHQMLVSPMRQSRIQMDRRSLLEADLWNAVSNETKEDIHQENSSSSESSSDDQSQAHDGGSEIDSDTSTNSSAFSSFKTRFNSQLKTSSMKQRSTSERTRLTTLNSKQSWLLGASEDILMKSDLTSPMSSCSQSTDTGAYSSTGDLMMMRYHKTNSSIDHDLDRADRVTSSIDLESQTASALECIAEKQQQQQLVDENLMKGFTCFVYNRLAKGQTSFTNNDGTYVYSYFLWFKRNSVRSSSQ